MNTIVAILMYLGVATSPGEVGADMVIQNADVILSTVENPNFINYYKSQYTGDYNVQVERTNAEVVITDFEEGN